MKSMSLSGSCLRLVLACLLIGCILIVVGCDFGSAWREKTIDGKTYHYREFEPVVTDITTDTLGTKGVETDHFIIDYSIRFAPYLDSIITVSENAFEKITHDLEFTEVESKIPTYYLDRGEFYLIAGSNCGGHVVFQQSDSMRIIINSKVFRFDTTLASCGINHELTHYVLDLMRGKEYVRTDAQGQSCFQTNHDFEEALCQIEEPRPRLAELLLTLFTESQYIPFDTIDSWTTYERINSSYAQFRALIRMMTEKWGWKSVLETVRHQANYPLKQAIFMSTGTAYPELEPMWFAYMDSLKSTADTAMVNRWPRESPPVTTD